MKKTNSNIMLSVIIVSYNCLPYLQKTIDSIWQYNDIGNQLEIIVVDNSADNQTIEWLASNQPYVIAIKNDNRGFGQGNNIGAKAAHGKYLLFLNPDTLLIEPIFQWAVCKMKNDIKIGIFGVQLLDEEKKKNDSFGLRMPFGLVGTLFLKFCASFNIFIPKLMYPIGADLFMPRIVFEKIQGFDENIFLYLEEPDVCNRVNKLGYKVAYFSKHKIIHLEGRTCDLDLFEKYMKILSSMKYYCLKYNVDYHKFGKSERSSYQVKKVVCKLMRKKKREEQYRQIVEYWDNELNK